jgi:HAMP domain-containing protein
MSIRAKVILYAFFFLGASGFVGAFCYVNIRREEAAFEASRRAIKTHAAVADIEYFLVRQGRALENFVLLGDEAEKLQLAQAEAQASRRLQEWRAAAQEGEAEESELEAVVNIQREISLPARRVLELTETRRRAEAMERIEKEFAPARNRAMEEYRAIKSRTERAREEAERLMKATLHRNHTLLLWGLGVIVFLGLLFLLALARSVLAPVRRMREWADRVAQGDRNAVGHFTGRDEITDLARSVGLMAIQLARPRAASARNQAPPAPAVPSSPAAPVPAAAAPPAVPPPVAKPRDAYDEAVDEFRGILSGLAGRPISPSRKIG